MSVKDEVVALLIKMFPSPIWTQTSTLTPVEDINLIEDVGFDSLELIEFGMELELKFKVDVHEDEIKGQPTVGAVITLIQGKVGHE